MREVKYRDVLSVVGTLAMLARESLPVPAALQVARLMRAVEDAQRDVQMVQAQIIKRYVEHSDDGQPLLTEQGDYQYANEVARKSAEREWDKLLDQTLMIDATLDPRTLDESQLTPETMYRLLPFLSEE